MKWNHLPGDGGLDRQHPILMERFRAIFEIRGSYESQKAAREKHNTMGGKR